MSFQIKRTYRAASASCCSYSSRPSLVVGDGSHWAALEVPDACTDLFDEVLIVRDEEDGAFVLLQRGIERHDAFEVQVVRRFVEHQDVRLLQHQLAEEKARGLSTGKGLGLLQTLLTAEEHLSEQPANVFFRGLGVKAVQPFRCGRALGDRCGVVLREVADLRLVSPLHLAGVDVGLVGLIKSGVGEQRLEHCGLALSVAADKHNLIAAQNGGGKVADDVLGGAVRLRVALVHVLELEDVLATGADHVEPEKRALDIRACELSRLQTLDFLLAGVHLRAARAGGEARDELVELCDLLVALLVL